MSSIIGAFLILAAVCGVIYFGYTLVKEIIEKVRQRRKVDKK